MFLKVQFLEGTGRKEFFEKAPLKYVYVFRARQSPWMNGSPVVRKGDTGIKFISDAGITFVIISVE